MRYESIVFDFDGTLYDSLGEITYAVQQAAKKCQRTAPSKEAVRQAIGDGADALLHQVFGVAPSDKAIFGSIKAAYKEAYVDLELENPQLFVGIQEVLHELMQYQLKLAICSNKSAARLHKLIGDMGLSDCFGSIIGGDSLKFKKPSVEPLWECLRQLHAKDWSKTLLIGDSYQDYETARRAKVDFAWVSWGKIRTTPPTADCVKLHTPNQILELITK
jgi:phosphoglycolate phosphatase-like HAD superfamily hydrolase